MTTEARADTTPSTQLRRARAAVAAVFLTNGALFANIVPRYPQIKRELGLTNAELGTAIAAFPLGALVAGLFAATVIRRWRSARVAALGIVALAGSFIAIALAGNWLALAATMLVAGAIDAIVDVAQNTHGLRVQREYGRSIVNSLHGLWSVGAVLGGLMGSAAAGLDVSVTVHLTVAAFLFSGVALVALRFLLPGEDRVDVAVEAADEATAEVPPARRAPHPWRIVAALGILAVCGAAVEDAGSSWGALYLTDELAASAAVGGLAFAALQTAMTVGRLSGDRVVDRFGQAAVVRIGGIGVAGGMGLALAVPSVGTTLAGFAVAGLGVATLIPAVFHAADEIPGLAHGVGLTVVSWLLRIGFLGSAPLVGVVADAVSLRVALLGVVAAGVVMVALADVLGGGRTPADAAG